jgi:hypothetical protein
MTLKPEQKLQVRTKDSSGGGDGGDGKRPNPLGKFLHLAAIQLESIATPLASPNTLKEFDRVREELVHVSPVERPNVVKSSPVKEGKRLNEVANELRNMSIDSRLQKVTKSRRKSRPKSCPSSISLKRTHPTRPETFQQVVQSKVQMAYFLSYLIQERCYEMILFYIDTTTYESQYAESSLKEVKRALRRIKHTYFDSSSSLEVNISMQGKRITLERIKQCIQEHERVNNNVFELAKKEVLSSLEDSYRKFKRSPLFERMCKEFNAENRYDLAAKCLCECDTKGSDDAKGVIVKYCSKKLNVEVDKSLLK